MAAPADRVVEKTQMAEGEDAQRVLRDFLSNAKEGYSACIEAAAASLIEFYYDVLREYGSRDTRIRYIVEITKDNRPYIKKMMEVSEVRHLDNIKGNFAVSKNSYLASATLQETTSVTHVIYSTIRGLVEQNQYIFETLWNVAVPAEQRIKEIEGGASSERTEAINDPNKTKTLYKTLISRAEREVLLMLPTANTVEREKKIGIIEALEQASASGVKVRVLIAEDGMQVRDIARLESLGVRIHPLARQQPGGGATTNIKMAIVDGRTSFVIELKDDSMEFEDAIGPAVMSTSSSIVMSYSRIFESLWLEAESIAKLQETDRVQREFINVAAHELRTPIQPILITAYLLGADEPEGKNEDEEIAVKRKYLTIIFRNAKRLQQLSSNILEVARLESRSFKLNRQRINLDDVIRDELRSARSKNAKVEWQYEPKEVFVEADEGRLAEVMANLLSNAARFTEKGSILITVERQNGEVTVRVSDTGVGIDPEVMPRLFQKFASKSEANTGTGLGLFISKSIVEAHGGRIWAESNSGGGTTFSFSLPAT